MAIPENAQNIYQFLTSHGYSAIAASGILGNIEQESGGDPTAGTNPPGAGLIQQLGDPGGSLSSEEQKILTYNNQQGSQLISELNSQSSASSAALFYSQYFERPNAALANNTNREDSATQVYNAAQSGSWPAGSGATSGSDSTGDVTTGLTLNPASWATGIIGAVSSSFGGDIKDWLERGGLIVLGFVLVIMGISMLSSGGGSSKRSSNSSSKPPKKEDTVSTKGPGNLGTEQAVESAVGA
jgi:hypothetical protein